MEFRDVIVKEDASTPLNFTEVVPIKPLPLIYTCVPGVPEVGVNDVIIGRTVKLVALDAVPDGVVTDTLPVNAVADTVAVIEVSESTEKVEAACPLNFTEVAPVRPLPLIVTVVPVVPESGVKDAIFGKTVNDDVLVAVPACVVTDIGPLVAVTGTVALMEFRDVIVKEDASTPLNFTEVVPIKPLPLIYICVPGVPEVGVNDVIIGRTVKLVALDAVPDGVVTDTLPVNAVADTVAVIEVSESTEKVEAACPLNFTEVAPVRPLPLIVTVVPVVPES